MDALRENEVEFTEAELAYMNSGGQTPLPSEPEPEPEAREPEPVTEASAEPEAQGTEEADPEVIEDGDETHKGRKVGYSAYLRKKAEADAARKEREELREKLATSERERAVENARIQERFRQFQEMQQRQAAQAQPLLQPASPPDRNEDPLGYMAWQDERLNRLEQYTTQSAEHQRQSRAIAQLDDTYRRDNHQAAREVPEFVDAYNFMIQRGAQIIASRNPGLTADQVKAAVEHEERQIAASALQSGERPAARVLRMAMAYGWAPRAQTQAQEPAQQAQPDPAAEQAKLDAVARGQAQNRSLSATGRPGTSTAAMTLERFLSLSDDEAREWGQKNPREFERLAGGR